MQIKTNQIEELLTTISKQTKKYNPAVNEMIKLQNQDPFKTFITGFLSPRTKDEITIKISKNFFKKIQNISKISKHTQTEIEKLIYPVGFYKTKAKNLIQISKQLQKENKSQIPNNLEELKKLPGIGNKIANLILTQAFQIPTICVDTHVHRISNRLNIINTKTITQTQKQLEQKIPKKLWTKYNPTIVALGQTICKPQNPKCEICKIKNKCNYYYTKQNLIKK